MKWTNRIVTSLFFITCFTSYSFGESLVVGVANWKPWQIYKNDKWTGISIEIIQEVVKRTGDDLKFDLLPLNRTLLGFIEQKIDIELLINPGWRHGEQAAVSIYTIPVCVSQDIVLVRKDYKFDAISVDDFKGMTLGTTLGYFYSDGFSEAMSSGDIIRDDVYHTKNNILKLSKIRADGAIFDKRQAFYFINSFGMDVEDFYIAYYFKPTPLSFRLHKKWKKLIPHWNKAIIEMKEDGTLERIISKYPVIKNTNNENGELYQQQKTDTISKP